MNWRSSVYVWLILLTSVGALLRLYQLSLLPATMHRDETAIAYNAYSILQTGKDEHGVVYPLNFQSFGDYKLPGMIYATTVSIAAFGLNTFAARLPTALFGIFTIPLAYWLTREMGWSKRVGLVTALLLTFSFWHISQSRNIYEPIAGLFFTTLGWSAWLAGRKKAWFYIIAVLAFIIGSLFYNLPFLLLPMLFVGSWLILRDWSKKPLIEVSDRWQLAASIVILIFAAVLIMMTGEVNQGKSSTTILSHPELQQKSQLAYHAGLVAGMPSIIARGVNHPLVLASMQGLKGYVSAFDPTYLFFTGDHNAWHNLQSIGLGNLNPALIIFFGLGLYIVLRNYRHQRSQLALFYLLVAPLVSAITIDAPITNRLLDFHLAVLLLAAIGVDYWLLQMNKSRNLTRLIFPATAIIYLGFFVYFVTLYFFQFNSLMSNAWNPGLHELITEVQHSYDDYQLIYITPELDLGYTYFAFYVPFDPANFQETAVWGKDGFMAVRAYDKYRFARFPKLEELSVQNVAQIFSSNSDRILVIEKGKPSVEATALWKSINWHGQWQWFAWQTDLNQVILELARLPINPDRLQTLAYLKSCDQEQCDLSLLEIDEEINEQLN